jgi:transposase
MAEKKYNRDFQKEAVELWLRSGRSAKQIADELGISANSLSNWKKKFDSELPGELDGENPEKEIAKLKKELARVSEERDILKKAVGIFSKDRK